jgi:hypothetical protein
LCLHVFRMAAVSVQGRSFVFRTVVTRCARLQDGGGLALQGLTMASGGRAFLASHKPSPTVDSDDG